MDWVVVDLEPAGVFLMWPASVASSIFMNLLILSFVKPGKPFRYPAFAAAIRVLLGCDPKDA